MRSTNRLQLALLTSYSAALFPYAYVVKVKGIILTLYFSNKPPTHGSSPISILGLLLLHIFVSTVAFSAPRIRMNDPTVTQFGATTATLDHTHTHALTRLAYSTVHIFLSSVSFPASLCPPASDPKQYLALHYHVARGLLIKHSTRPAAPASSPQTCIARIYALATFRVLNRGRSLAWEPGAFLPPNQPNTANLPRTVCRPIQSHCMPNCISSGSYSSSAWRRTRSWADRPQRSRFGSGLR